MSRKIAVWALAGAAAFATGSRALAQELVQNGDFETGDLTGWTEFGETTYNGVWDGEPHGGAYSGYFGPLGTGGIQQTLTANVGDSVTISYWYVSETGLTPNSMTVMLGSLPVQALTDITTTSYVQFTATMTVADANPLLQFTFSNPNDYIDLDDVSVMVVTQGGGCGSADFDCDGSVGTDNDISAFFACLSGNCPPAPCTSSADFNGDGNVGTDDDISAFFRVLGGGTC